ncbi:hypothetical protein COCMIDRAFT_109002 [Bipolaris oryzae ATCC 44560]|uniref:MACPF domain-containing protein n=1 Tax=Bipolaris oryzae ATCC 44560 TaxID=930090 RepID=W6YS77_COCMI|nr:uncharacterized protein COCMIDRAFT_109002 [Bipolaris oryzae ATCC 44560]EUC40363.1 hypothetical protein COCMIDRAFT_109002 [Bipolaris oryzae ATCC 44560]
MNDLQNLASQGLPLYLPWSKDYIAIGSGFNSASIASSSSPWVSKCPYIIDNAKCVMEISGTTSSYREGNSFSSVQHSEHLSASLGVTVGCKFLSANVTGSYDETVSDNLTGTRVSKNISFRAGHVRFKADPQLTPYARNVLCKSENEFCSIFGDYYIAGYQIGADAGGCVTIEHKDQSEEKMLQIRATAKVLWIEMTISTTTSSKEVFSNHTVSFKSYDTLQQCIEKSEGANLEEIHQMSKACMNRIGNLQAIVEKKLLELGLNTSGGVSVKECAQLCESGVVVQLILAPYSKLAEYVALTSSHNSYMQ